MIRWGGTTPTASNEEWYLYDVSGNRVMRRSASTTTSGNPATSSATITTYAFGEEHAYSYTGSGTTMTNTSNTSYYSLVGKLIGSYNGTSTSFILTDLLGSVVSTISNTSGSAVVLGNQLYGPYGNRRYTAGTMGTAKGYTGQYTDDLTGLNYYNARYYDPVSSRFTVADIVQGNLGGFDPYAYVKGNPETDCDPTGQADYNADYVVAWYRTIHGGDTVKAFSYLNGDYPDILNDTNSDENGNPGAPVAWDAKTGSFVDMRAPGYMGLEADIKGTMPPDVRTIWQGSNDLQKTISGSKYQAGSIFSGDPGYDPAMAHFFNTSSTCLWQIECFVFFADGAVLVVSTPTITVSAKQNSVHLVRGIIAYSFAQGTIDFNAPKDIITYEHYKQLYPDKAKQIPERPRYVVQPGDTLWGISTSVYGSGSQWQNLYQKNSGTIGNPNLIYLGEVLYY